jgi:hypothetical protein
MKIDTFISLINNIRQGQLEDDTDPSNTVIQQYTSPYDTMTVAESVMTMKSSTSSLVWGDGTTYIATDAQGNKWNAPSCGWLWGSGGRWS